jgi:hypothetical protein
VPVLWSLITHFNVLLTSERMVFTVIACFSISMLPTLSRQQISPGPCWSVDCYQNLHFPSALRLEMRALSEPCRGPGRHSQWRGDIASQREAVT